MGRTFWHILPLLIAMGFVAGCQQEVAENGGSKPAEYVAVAVAVDSPPVASNLADAGVGQARVVKIENELMQFTYAYPAAAAAIPALKAQLDLDLSQAKAELTKEALEAKNAAAKDGFDFRAHSRDMKWQVVADLPHWLSLSSLVGFYSGGAHPNSSFAAILWDKARNVPRKAEDVFVSKAALNKAIREKFCAILDGQRAKKRGEKVSRASGNEFDACIDPLAETMILGSSDKQHFNRIGFLIAPYNAGPYAEGSYEVTLPITPEILALVKPEFRESFVVK